MSAAFSPAMKAALDRYDVPALPQGFADRLVARATAVSALEPTTSGVRRNSSPWKRTSRILGSVGLLGFFSATAAAMGLFGEPIEVPLISHIARQMELVEQQVAVTNALASTNNSITMPAVQTESSMEDVDDVAKQALSRVVDDPRFETLTPRQKLLAVRHASRKLVRSESAKPEEVRAALREIRSERRVANVDQRRPTALRERLQTASPEQKAKLREKYEALPLQRQDAIKEKLGITAIMPNETTPSVRDISDVGDKDTSNPANENPALITSQDISNKPAVELLKQVRIDNLRDKYLDASPEQRAAARERIRQRRDQVTRPNTIPARRDLIRQRRN